MLKSVNQGAKYNVSTSKSRPFVRRQARPGWVAIDFAELWRYRELLVFQAVRDIRVRYKQTVLGVSWAILQPVVTMVVFSLFFGKLAKLPSDGIPYPIFTFCALLNGEQYNITINY